MKLSEMNTKQLSEVMINLAEPVGAIAMDQGAVEALREIGQKHTEVEQLGLFVKKIIPFLLDTHFDDTCTIIAVMSGKKAEEVKKQKGIQTLKDARDIFDADFIDFFKSFVHTEPKK